MVVLLGDGYDNSHFKRHSLTKTDLSELVTRDLYPLPEPIKWNRGFP